jgi:light-regulated signal transduction histidine kinase (bacteriophytochrome)
MDPEIWLIIALLVLNLASWILFYLYTKKRKPAARSKDTQPTPKAHTNSESEIVRINQELELMVAERTTELLAYTKELEAFSYSVSHDLSAPLRTINGFSTALLEDYDSALDEQGKDYLRRIKRGVDRMTGLIDDLLSLSMITRREISISRIDLTELATEIANTYKNKSESTFNISGNLQVVGDRGLVRITMENLIGNAVKYSSNQAHPQIDISAESHQGQEFITIKDNGVGFDMAYAFKLFVPFQRLHTDYDFEGNGIGLALVQRIINKHGGEIRVESSPGKGTKFIFRFCKEMVQGSIMAS